MDCSPPGSSVHGISQARILEWVAIPLSNGTFWTQGSNPHLLLSRCLLLGRRILYHWATTQKLLTLREISRGIVTSLCTLNLCHLLPFRLPCISNLWSFSLDLAHRQQADQLLCSCLGIRITMTSVFHYLAYLGSCSPKFQSYIDRNPYIAQWGKWVEMWRVTKCHSMPPNISQCPLPLEHASNTLNTIELIYHFQDLVIKDCWFSYKRLLISLSLSLLNHLLWGKPDSWGPAQWRSPCGKEQGLQIQSHWRILRTSVCQQPPGWACK